MYKSTGDWRGQSVSVCLRRRLYVLLRNIVSIHMPSKYRLVEKLGFKQVRLCFSNNNTLNLSRMTFHRSDTSRSDDSTKGNHCADSGIESDSFSPTSHVSVKHSYPSDCVMASHNFSQSRVSGRQAGNRRKFLPDNHPQRPHEFNQQLYIEKSKFPLFQVLVFACLLCNKIKICLTCYESS